MADYAKTIEVAGEWVREGMRQAPTDEQRDLWSAMLERLAMIEKLECSHG